MSEREGIPTDAICVRCKTVKTHQVPISRLRREVDDYSRLVKEDFLSFQTECVCSDEETWHNVVGVHRGLIKSGSGD